LQVVTERLLCHAIIGSKAGKTQIMQVDVTCEFIAPVLQLSSREITFRVEKVSGWVVSSCYGRAADVLHLPGAKPSGCKVKYSPSPWSFGY